MRVLGVDPGLNNVGYSILELDNGLELILAGSYRTRRSKSLSARLGAIVDHLEGLLKEYSPDICVVETLFYGKNPRSTISLSHARGAILAAMHNHNVDVVEYAPQEVKRAICGSGRASKEQVSYMVKRLLNTEVDFNQDVSDAIALALCYTNRAGRL
jgi:crossover junction endodeoxyribonuclease RuvC